MIELTQWARNDQLASYNKTFISLINDVMKANSVKIACKQLDLSLLMNSVSFNQREGTTREGVWAWGVQFSSLRASQHPKIPLSQ